MGQNVDDPNMQQGQNDPTAQHDWCMQHDEMRCMEQDEMAEAGRKSATQGCMEHDEMGCVEQDEVGQLGPSMEQWNVALNKVQAIRSCD